MTREPRNNPFSTIILTSFQVSDFQFDAQRKTFHSQGYAEDPTAYASTVGTTYVGEVDKAAKNEGRTVFEESKEKVKKRKREHFGDPSDPEGYKGFFIICSFFALHI